MESLSPPQDDVTALEIRLLLDGIYERWGYDFRDYAVASMRRRVLNFVSAEGASSVSTLQETLLRDAASVTRFILAISIPVTSLFRDPDFFLLFRQKVVPELSKHPVIRVWHAGCASGEEVYSTAILLQEEGLYDRTRIYATDMNEAVIARARAGIFLAATLRDGKRNYEASGGKKTLASYYTADHEHAIFRAALRQNIVFATHNLATDKSFNEFHVIMCRNVMIYFNRKLQARVFSLFHESLAVPGFLGLGDKESITVSPYEASYKELAEGSRVYRRMQ